ncbi:hypothetical protein T492DRAFT_458956 [Pavlovales sp. CCMP2436]|nr:hypothetical protein T492DRAFT_458956 [Pavlovales sp. CCMP2436]
MAADDGAQSLNYTAVLARTPLAQSQRLFTIESVSDLTDDMGAASLGATGQPEAPSKPALTLPLGSMPRLYELTSETPTAEQDAMLDPGWNGVHPSRFEVRGPTYLHDKKKISGPALFTTAGVDVFRSTKVGTGFLSRTSVPGDGLPDMSRTTPQCEEDFAIRPAYAAYQILEAMPATELFILNIQLPGPPFTGLLQVCSKPLVSPEMARVMEGPEGVAERLWHAFRDGTDEFRSKRLKLIANPIKVILSNLFRSFPLIVVGS